MERLSKLTEELMLERFGVDRVIALVTTFENVPYVRSVNAIYFDGSFYVLTHGMSRKMKHIEQNPMVAISVDWFTAHGKGINMGYFGKPENENFASEMRVAFSSWIDNGHNDFDDVNTIILRIKLTDGLLLCNGKRYDIDFSEQP